MNADKNADQKGGGEVATVKETRCKCHPETCCCGSYTLWLAGKPVTNGGLRNMQTIAEAINSATVPEAVDEAMVRRSLDAQPFFYSRNQGARVWQLFLDERDSEEIVRAILTAALLPEQSP